MKAVIKIFSILKISSYWKWTVGGRYVVSYNSTQYIKNVEIASIVIWFNNMYYSVLTYWVYQC